MSARLLPVLGSLLLAIASLADPRAGFADSDDEVYSDFESRHSLEDACGAFQRLKSSVDAIPHKRIALGAVGSAIGFLIEAGAGRISRNELLYFSNYAFFRSEALIWPVYGAFEREVLKTWATQEGYRAFAKVESLDTVVRLTKGDIRAFNFAFLEEMVRHLRAENSEIANRLIRAITDRRGGVLEDLVHKIAESIPIPRGSYAKVAFADLFANAKGFILEKFVVRDPALARAVLRFSAVQLGEVTGGAAGRCVRYGGKALKWGGIISGVLADLLTTTPARAQTLDEAYRLDPSHLFDAGVTPDAACKRLEGDVILRNRFMMLAGTMAAGEERDARARQKEAYGDDVFCGGPGDELAHEAFVNDLIATGAYRRATPADFGSAVTGEDPNAKRIRFALAKATGVVPAR